MNLVARSTIFRNGHTTSLVSLSMNKSTPNPWLNFVHVVVSLAGRLWFGGLFLLAPFAASFSVLRSPLEPKIDRASERTFDNFFVNALI